MTVDETPAGSNTGTYNTTLLCVRTGSNPPVEVPNSSDGAFNMPNYPVTCTYTNNRTSNDLQLVKKWTNPATGDSTTLDITGGTGGPVTGPAPAPNDTTISSAVRSGAAVTVDETPAGSNTGTYNTTLLCVRTGSNPPVEVPNSSDGAFNMPNYPVTCTYTNNRTSNDLQLVKKWTNPAAGDSTTLDITGGTGGPVTGPAPAPNDTTISSAVRSGAAVTVDETPAGSNTGTYNTTLLCVRTGSNPPVEVPNSSDGAFDMPNYPVTCTYTNNRTSNDLQLVKKWTNPATGDSTTAGHHRWHRRSGHRSGAGPERHDDQQRGAFRCRGDRRRNPGGQQHRHVQHHPAVCAHRLQPAR